MQQTRVIDTTGDLAQIKSRLLSLDGVEERESPGAMSWQLSVDDRGTITAYASGKIVIQSKDEKWMTEILNTIGESHEEDRTAENFTPHIGVDEAGKGDFFGPLVVSAAFLDAKTMVQLSKIGVRDSKKLSDLSAIDQREKILSVCSGCVSEVVIKPKQYNNDYIKLRNANILLAKGHARAIEDVLTNLPQETNCTQVIIDQFSKRESRVLDELLENGKKLEVIQRHKGESDIAVAAASIVARGRFLLELQKMSEVFGMEFPKGASDVVAFGKRFVRKFGVDALDEVAKTSFKTALKITGTFDI